MDLIKQSRENERQKKIQEQKLKAVKLRIKNLKNKKNIYYKRKKNESIKEKNINEIKENKNNLRNSINIINEDKKKEILKKFQKAKEEKYKIEMGIKISKNKNLKKPVNPVSRKVTSKERIMNKIKKNLKSGKSRANSSSSAQEISYQTLPQQYINPNMQTIRSNSKDILDNVQRCELK